MARQKSPERRRRRTRLETHYVRKRTFTKDNEGNTIPEYGDPQEVSCEVWPAGGKVQTEQYGDRVTNIYNVHIDGAYTPEIVDGVVQYHFENGVVLREHDGFCYFADGDEDPDCQIIAIKPYRPLYAEVERK